MAALFPMAKAQIWTDMPGAVTMEMQKVQQIDGLPNNSPSRILAIVDFNVPNARDSLKLPQIAAALATIFKNCRQRPMRSPRPHASLC